MTITETKNTTIVYESDKPIDKELEGSEPEYEVGVEVDEYDVDPKEDKRLVRKIDLYVCVYLCIVYAAQYMDKIAVSASSMLELREDLEMTVQMYSWAASGFYVGYLVFQIPAGIILQKFPLAKATGLFITFWGIILAASAASQNYAGYETTRVLLGMFEGAITPSFIVVTAQWYKINEQYSRSLIWYGASGLGIMFINSVSYGIYKGEHSIAGWRLLHIILGLITVLIGVGYYFHIPDTPSEAWFLNERERLLVARRTRDNKQTLGTHKIKMYQIKEAFMDPHTWLYFFTVFVITIPNGGLNNFTTIILHSLNYDEGEALLMGIPPGALEVTACLTTAWLSYYFFRNTRMFWSCYGCLVQVLALCLLAWGPTDGAQLAGIYLYNWAYPIAYSVLLSSISSNSAGDTKKRVVSAFLLMGWCAGSLVGPQTFKSSEADKFPTARRTFGICSVIVLVFQIVIWVYNYWENNRRDRRNGKLPPGVDSNVNDLTDFENPEFRYAL